ncbi:uncharacterized protein LTHEOB_8530 [Lasiodiplodia theobromae]|uniref:uncharacterized protein n=1 Tax=Lasiodiplodia theobromae TaxID=45133 RepID=UPI0015C3EBD0|nr:uncharacterized protein LTHEOB_8530 [Lasiodiplodia theobromae]KAF4541535.1 hypothetical protein LTHEOB_8530 [Lasiodiplodia theobromae]
MKKSANKPQDGFTEEPPTGQKSQEPKKYGHYIPRFLLRNFAHHSEAAILRNKKFEEQKRNQKIEGKRGKKKKWSKPDMLYVLQLEPEIKKTEVELGRVFGQDDMYRDLQRSTNQHHVEEQLGKLECAVAPIIRKIREAQENGLPTVQLLRTERDELRRFLFVMRYRGSNQHKRFYHRDIETYNAPDRHRMVQYMRKKGFKEPIEVWLDNIKTMAEVKIDKDGEWFSEILDRMYPGDAEWAFVNLQLMYLSFCTPSEHDEEFLLTENAFDIYEGPVSFQLNPITGEKITTACTEYHNFAVISPKIMMVLRSTLLPNAEEDALPGMREKRRLQREMHRRLHSEYDMTGSFLETLPVTKARNSYTKIVGGMPVLIDGEDGTPRADHRFDFRFFPLNSTNVQRINAVILNESYNSSSIAFVSPVAARKALEYYLTDPCKVAGAYPLKIVSDPYDPTLLQLQKLEQAARLLGSDVRLMYNVHTDDSGRKFLLEQEILEELRRRAAERDAAFRGDVQSPGSAYTGNQFTPPPRWQYQYLLPEIPKFVEQARKKREREHKNLETKECEMKKSGMDGSENRKTESEMDKSDKRESEKKKYEAKVQDEKVLARTQTSTIQDVTPKKLKKPKNILNSSGQRETPGSPDSQGGEPDYGDVVFRLRYLILLIIALGVVYYYFFKLLWRSYIWIRSLVPQKNDHHRNPLTEKAAEEPRTSREEKIDGGEGSKGSMDTSSQSLGDVETVILVVLSGLATFISVIAFCLYCVRYTADRFEEFDYFIWEMGKQVWNP